MAVLNTYVQQPDDRLDYDIPYLLNSDDSLASVAVEVTPAGLDVTGLVDPDATSTVKLWVEGGVSGTKYKVEVTITTTLGRVKEDEVIFKIRNY